MAPANQQQSNPSLFGYATAPQDPWQSFMQTKVVQALQDPRLAMLMGPGMGLIRAPGAAMRAAQLIPSMAERGSWNPMGWRGTRPVGDALPDQGGSNIPLANRLEHNPNPMIQNRLQMTREGVPFDDHAQAVYAKTHMLDVRGDNLLANSIMNTGEDFKNRRVAGLNIYENLSPEHQAAVDRTVKAIQSMQDMTGYAPQARTGFVPQPEMIRRLFGPKKNE
jgi:hypothetical protein